MTEPLFREEAVEYIRRGRGAGDVVRVAPRWTAVAFWTLLALAIAAVAAAALIDVDRVRLAPAVGQGTTVRAVVPAKDAPRRGATAEFALTETGDRADVVIEQVGAPQSGAVAVTARAREEIEPGPGVLEIKVGERPLIADLIPGSSSER
ncbi:MAG TPA: hypothetical protein VF529_19380 [Solirubrobacteraceae bacterium]|jgi:hypothetical protein